MNVITIARKSRKFFKKFPKRWQAAAFLPIILYAIYVYMIRLINEFAGKIRTLLIFMVFKALIINKFNQ